MIYQKKQFTADAICGYVVCLLWSESDDDGNSLSDTFGAEDIAPVSIAEIEEQVADFVDANWLDVRGMNASQTGHDFALTRNGHGAGFWDRGLGELGERLTVASKVYGTQGLCAGDDGALYMHG